METNKQIFARVYAESFREAYPALPVERTGERTHETAQPFCFSIDQIYQGIFEMSVSNDNTPSEQQRLKTQIISYACTYQLFYGHHETAQLLCGFLASLMKDAPLELKQEIMEYLKNSCS